LTDGAAGRTGSVTRSTSADKYQSASNGRNGELHCSRTVVPRGLGTLPPFAERVRCSIWHSIVNKQYRRLCCQRLLPTAAKSLIELDHCNEFVALRLRQSELGGKRVGLVCQYFQVIGGSGFESYL